MSKEARYAKLSDEEVVKETQERLRRMKVLLVEIRDALKSAGGIE
ncbi:MAG TPA: hypothetical protein VM050_03745 [Patescibacteria group bacterium]|nr:hypothetical protein [Patescibacteria group bacterium]